MWASPQACPEPGCGRASAQGSRFCERHQADNYVIRRDRTRNDRTPWRRWYGLAQWARIKDHFRATCPERALICQAIENGQKCGHPATDIDHVQPHKGDWLLFCGGPGYSNLQGLCKSHHSKKTASEDGGFSNDRR